MKSFFASFLHRITARAEIVMLSQHFRTAVDVARAQPYDDATYDYAVNNLNTQIKQIFASVPSIEDGKTDRDERNNLELDYWRARRMYDWIKKVGPQTTSPYDEKNYELYLKTISNAAEATQHGKAPESNWVLACYYARLLPVAVSCSHVTTDKSWNALDIYMVELGKVWEAVAPYDGHKSAMGRELLDSVNRTNSHQLWGKEESPRFGEYRTDILRLIRT